MMFQEKKLEKKYWKYFESMQILNHLNHQQGTRYSNKTPQEITREHWSQNIHKLETKSEKSKWAAIFIVFK